MLYGIGGVPPELLKNAVAALPDCFSQELSNCLDHGNVNGLPKAQCDAINGPYSDRSDEKTHDAMNTHVNALPVCQGPSMVPYIGAAFAAGIFLTAIVLKR